MDKFVKRVATPPVNSAPAKRRALASAKQGNVAARSRCSEYSSGVFYVDSAKMFCRPCNMVVDHTRKSVVAAHLKSKVSRLMHSKTV